MSMGKTHKSRREIAEQKKREIERENELEAEEKEVEEIKDGILVCVSDKLKEDLKQVEEELKTATISTGFESLDNELGGGLRTGSLIILGGIPSLGKTTLALNIANNVAKTGRDVLFFSLEMSRVELVLKSISRQTFMPDNAEQQIDSSYMKIMAAKALSVIDFYNGKCTETQKEEWQKAVDIYCEKVASHLHIAECSGNVDVETIKAAIKDFMSDETRQLKPLIIVDYMQNINSSEKTDKQAVDANMTSLKRIARDYKVVIIAISSFNRNNYYTEVGYESFKESGGIDYGADVVIGLQVAGYGDNTQENKETHDKAKTAYPRKLKLRVVKNRIFKSGVQISFDYYPKYDCFCEEQ